MTRTLADFRIENDHVVLLSFAGGGKYRVSPDELPKYLSKPDLQRVNAALKLRRKFIRDTLPPTSTGIVLLAVLSLAGLGALYYPAGPDKAPKASSMPAASVPIAQEQTGVVPEIQEVPVDASVAAPPTESGNGSEAAPAAAPAPSGSATTAVPASPHPVNAAKANSDRPASVGQDAAHLNQVPGKVLKVLK